MYCTYCGNELIEGADVCVKCGKIIANKYPNQLGTKNPPLWTAGFVISIISLPFFSMLILGILGLIFGIVSKRKSSIIMSSISLGLFLVYMIFIITEMY